MAKMNVYVMISVVMISSLIFLGGALASPLKSIILPINIPVQFNFELEQLIDPRYNNNGGNPYEIVVLTKDGNELLRLKPEEASNAIRIVASDLNGNGKLVWGTSNNLDFYAAHAETFRVFRASFAGPLAPAGNEFTDLAVAGSESGFQGQIRIDAGKGSGSEDIILEDLKWPLSGRSIPLAGGKAETGPWTLTTMPESPVDMIVNRDDQVTIKYVSFFSSPYLYAEDLTTGEKMPVAFDTTISGSINPPPSALPSYINSQIYLQGFGWLIPVAALMAIIWVDDRYRRRIRKMIKAEAIAQ